MKTETILMNALYSLAVVICLFGVKEDCKERKFSNQKIIVLIVLGVMAAISANRIKEGLILFFTMNILGMFLSAAHFLGASDWKLFSALCLFIPFENISYSIVFIIMTFISTIIIKIAYTNKGYLKQSFADELKALKVFIYTRQRLQYDASQNIYKTETIPASIPIVSAFIICNLILI